MSDVPLTRKALLDVLNRIADAPNSNSSSDILTQDLRRAFCDFGSETPDNLNCASRICVGAVGPDVGLKFRRHPVLFADVAHVLEDEPIPPAVKECYPELEPDDWNAFTRLTTLFYSLLTRHAEASK